MEELRTPKVGTETETLMQNRLTCSVEEMGKMMGLSRAVSYRLSRTKGFPTIHIGGRVLISIPGLKDWIANRTAQEAEEQ